MLIDEKSESPDNGNENLRVGIDLLLTKQVARREHVSERTVERWIGKGLPARTASQAQIGELVLQGFLQSVPPQGVYLIHIKDLALVPQIRAYPKGTKRPNRRRKLV